MRMRRSGEENYVWEGTVELKMLRGTRGERQGKKQRRGKTRQRAKGTLFEHKQITAKSHNKAPLSFLKHPPTPIHPSTFWAFTSLPGEEPYSCFDRAGDLPFTEKPASSYPSTQDKCR